MRELQIVVHPAKKFLKLAGATTICGFSQNLSTNWESNLISHMRGAGQSLEHFS